MSADAYVPLHEAKRRDHAAEKLRRGLHVIYPSSLEGQPVPERRWVVPGLLPVGSVSMLSGDGGIGKSTLLLQLLATAALGVPFLGFAVPPIRALGIFAEDDADELHRRMAAILPALGAGFGDLEDRLTWVSRVGLDNLMMTWDARTDAPQVTPFHAQVMNHAVDTGSQLVVLDSLHDLFGGNENHRGQVRQFVGSLREIALETEGAVVLAAHPSVAGLATGTGTSGSTAWNNAVRSRLYLKRPPEDAEAGEPDRAARILTHPKSNYSADGGEWRLRLVDGAFIRDEAGGGFVDHLAMGNQESADDAVFLRCLDVLTAQNRNVSHSTNAKNYAAKEMAGMKEAGRVGRGRLEAAMKRLFSAGEILANQPVGSRANRHPQYGIQRASKSPDGGA